MAEDTTPAPSRQARTIEIPTDWTVTQAEAVYEFLAHVADQVFYAYEKPILERTIQYLEEHRPNPTEQLPPTEWYDEELF